MGRSTTVGIVWIVLVLVGFGARRQAPDGRILALDPPGSAPAGHTARGATLRHGVGSTAHIVTRGAIFATVSTTAGTAAITAALAFRSAASRRIAFARRSYALSVTLTTSNVSLARRVSIVQCTWQRTATPLEYLTVERTLIRIASTSLDAAICLMSPVSGLLAGLHARNSRCV